MPDKGLHPASVQGRTLSSMDILREYLESSTVHGLCYVSTVKVWIILKFTLITYPNNYVNSIYDIDLRITEVILTLIIFGILTII